MNTPELDLAGRYKPYKTDKDALAIWSFLNEPSTIIRMDTATFLGRPALEALTQLLLNNFSQCFDSEQQEDNKVISEYKRLTGHMVRKVLENHGLEHYKSGVKVRTGIFSTASLFRKK